MSEEKKRLRFGVIGLGRMGLRRVKLAHEHPETTLVAVTDVQPELAKKVAEQFGCAVAASEQELIARDDIDVVFVSTPNVHHLGAVTDALAHGKHVFCEKPLARTIREAQQMVKAVRLGTTLKVGANLRFFPNVRKAKMLMEEGRIGQPLFLRAWIGHQGWNLGGAPWYGDPEQAGGGTYLDNGVHVFDVVRWYLGEPLSCIGTMRRMMNRANALEDNGFGIFEMANGSVAYVQSSWTEWAGYMYLELYGTEGFLRIDNRGSAALLVIGDKTGGEEKIDYSTLPPASFQWEFFDYVKALLTGAPPVPSGLDGLRAMQMAFAAYESSATGRKSFLADLTGALVEEPSEGPSALLTTPEPS